jgi:hypothetical protein
MENIMNKLEEYVDVQIWYSHRKIMTPVWTV